MILSWAVEMWHTGLIPGAAGKFFTYSFLVIMSVSLSLVLWKVWVLHSRVRWGITDLLVRINS